MVCDDENGHGPPPTWKQCAKQHLRTWREKVEQGSLDYPSDESELDPEAQTNLIDRWAEVLRGLKRAHYDWQKRWLQAYGHSVLKLCTQSQLAALLGVPINQFPRRLDSHSLVAATLCDPLTMINEYRGREYHKRRWDRAANWAKFFGREHPRERKWRHQDSKALRKCLKVLDKRREERLRKVEGQSLDPEALAQLRRTEAEEEEERSKIFRMLRGLESIRPEAVQTQ
jgi:hypothetical protein